MNQAIMRLFFDIFTIFALLFFVGRFAFADSLHDLQATCMNAAREVSSLNCRSLNSLAAQVRSFGDIPPDGKICRQATEAYDNLADRFLQCSAAGTSEKGSCFSICRDVIQKIRNNEFENAVQMRQSPKGRSVVSNRLRNVSQKAELCYQISRESQKIRFESIKAPSCNYVTDRKPAEYIEPRTVRPVRNDKPGFLPIEQVETTEK